MAIESQWEIPWKGEMNPLQEYTWIVVFGFVAAMFTAFGIGANDVANAFATSVGSKSITIKQACGLACIFEFTGAILCGSSVAETIRKGIADTTCYQDSYMDAAVLMYGMLCVDGAVGIWLLLATFLELPVSTTHSCVGGIVGMAIVTKGSQCVIWYKAGKASTLFIPDGIIGIVISWFVSPICAALIAVFLFLFVRTFILRSKNSFHRAIVFYPFLIWVTVWINAFFIFSKGVNKQLCPSKSKMFMCSKFDSETKKDFPGKVDGGVACGVACATGLAAAMVMIPFYMRVKRNVELEFSEAGCEATATKLKAKKQRAADRVEADSKLTGFAKFYAVCRSLVMTTLDRDVHAELDAGTASKMVSAIHADAEVFDPKAEAVFKYIQILTACCNSFSHGANDVANAMGPFMSIWASFYVNKGNLTKIGIGDSAYWILGCGGIGICIGLLLYGYKIIQAIGIKLTAITPSRGFSMELGASTIIIIGSYIGLPLSTTHCIVGATVGVGLCEGRKGFNKFVLLKTCTAWVVTLCVAGITAGFLCAQGVHAPLAGSIYNNVTAQAIFLRTTCPRYMASQSKQSFSYINYTLYPTRAFCNSTFLNITFL